MKYNWQQEDWPDFTYDLTGMDARLLAFSECAGRVSGMIEALSEDVKIDVIISTMVAEAVKTSEIEGEYLSRQDVVSSIRNNMGFNPTLKTIKDKRVSGIAELMLDVHNSYAAPLNEESLFRWHTMLMRGNSRIKPGHWRTHQDPMQVVSGAIGKEKIHFEAPPSVQVPGEMSAFIKWFNQTIPGGRKAIIHAPVRAALAHLYFESIHPFEDGNGRIGRAISEKALSQNVGRPILLSLSQTIEADKKSYYQALEHSQRSNHVTPWIDYFIEVVLKAQKEAETQVQFVLKKARFFDRHEAHLNERQLKVVRKMLEYGPDGFEGGINARKYVSITNTSKATATRDLQDLRDKGILIPIGEGRSTRYRIQIE